MASLLKAKSMCQFSHGGGLAAGLELGWGCMTTQNPSCYTNQETTTMYSTMGEVQDADSDTGTPILRSTPHPSLPRHGNRQNQQLIPAVFQTIVLSDTERASCHSQHFMSLSYQPPGGFPIFPSGMALRL